ASDIEAVLVEHGQQPAEAVTGDHVIASTTVDYIRPVAADHQIVAAARIDRVVAAIDSHDQITAFAGRNGVVSGTVNDAIIAGAGNDRSTFIGGRIDIEIEVIEILTDTIFIADGLVAITLDGVVQPHVDVGIGVAGVEQLQVRRVIAVAGDRADR